MNLWQTYRADEIDLSEGLSRNKGEDCSNYFQNIISNVELYKFCKAYKERHNMKLIFALK